MNDQLSKIIEKLSQQINVEAISKKDLVQELTTLYAEVKKLEIGNKNFKESIEKKDKKIVKLEQDIIPSEKLKKAALELTRQEKDHKEEKFKFDIEKEYIERENTRLNEILMAILATKSVNYYDSSNGSSMNYNENPVKPTLCNLTNRSTKTN